MVRSILEFLIISVPAIVPVDVDISAVKLFRDGLENCMCDEVGLGNIVGLSITIFSSTSLTKSRHSMVGEKLLLIEVAPP